MVIAAVATAAVADRFTATGGCRGAAVAPVYIYTVKQTGHEGSLFEISLMEQYTALAIL